MSKPDAKMSPKELRKFGLVTAGMLILFFDLLIPWIWDIAMPVWPLYPAIILVSMALIIPAALGPFYTIWMRFSLVLGWINTRIILGLIFFLVFFPFGILMRMFNDPMRRKFDQTADSYRVSSNPTKPENMERPF